MPSSINFVKQIKDRRAAPKPEGGGGLASRFAALSAGGGKFDARDKILLVLFLLGVSSIPGAKYYVQEYIIREKTEEIEKKKSELDSQMAELDRKLREVKPIQAQIADFDKQKRDLNEMLNLIESVRHGRNSIVRMVDFVITEMPASVWLKKLDIDVNGSSGKVRLEGAALSLQLVSEYLKRLEGAVFFPKWELDGTKSVDGGTAVGDLPDTKSFSINAQVVNL